MPSPRSICHFYVHTHHGLSLRIIVWLSQVFLTLPLPIGNFCTYVTNTASLEVYQYIDCSLTMSFLFCKPATVDPQLLRDFFCISACECSDHNIWERVVIPWPLFLSQ